MPSLPHGLNEKGEQSIRTIEIIETGRGAAIRFPYVYKDVFRKQFPSAGWNADEKRWQVGPKNVARLKQFAEAVQQNLNMRIEREEREMTADEYGKLVERLATIDAEIAGQESAVDDIETARAEIATMKKKAGGQGSRA